MPKYRKKPILVEAEQWMPGKDVKGVQREFIDFSPDAGSSKSRYFVETMHNGQKIYLVPGDYIIPEPDGIHFYPVKAIIFEATYDPVQEEST